jgi:hypothetical protein
LPILLVRLLGLPPALALLGRRGLLRVRDGARRDQETGHSAEAKAAKSATSRAPTVYGMWAAATWGRTVSLAPAFAVRIAVRFGVLLRQNSVVCCDGERQASKESHFRVSKMRTLHLGFPSLPKSYPVTNR